MKVNEQFDTDDIKSGLAQVGLAYIENSDFEVEEYQLMIVHYLLAVLCPEHNVQLHFETPASGQLWVDNEVIPFSISNRNG